MTEIIVTKREDDYHATIKGHPEMWASGNTPYSAIGELVTSNQNQFGVEKITLKQEKEIKKLGLNSNYGTRMPNMNIDTTPGRSDR